MTDDEIKFLKAYNFLTNKPFVYAMNVSEDELDNASAIQKEYEEKLKRPVAIVCAKLESEMMELEGEDKAEYLSSLTDDVASLPTLDDLITLAFDTVGLMYYFTTGKKETRAWTVKK